LDIVASSVERGEAVNTIMSDQLCLKCQEREAVPGGSLCHDCKAEEEAQAHWTSTRPILTDLDELEDRPMAPMSGIVARLIWWVSFALIAALAFLLTVDRVHIAFLDNIPGVAELRDNLNSFTGWWDENIHKLGEGIGF
jgi:hypothetical protein